MNDSLIQLLFALLRSVIRGNPLSEREQSLYSADMLTDLMSISKKHDISHLVAEGLRRNDLLVDENQKIENEILKALYRYTQLNYEYEKLCAALEGAQIPFIPLKGSVLRQWYPEPWMRIGCDVDILVHEADVENAASYLIEHLGYTRGNKGAKDISLLAQNGNHIELHYGLIKEGLDNSSYDVLNSVWDTSFVRDGYKYWFEMSDEMFYFYHIAHMAKHFVFGGCGIRTFIDLWVLDHMEDTERNKRDELLKRGGLYRFAEASRLLSRVWFENSKHEAVSKQMEEYVLCGGVYGTAKNCITVQQQKKGGKLKYIISRIFLPYNVIKFHYPILQKHSWLTPFMEVRRWFKLIFCGHAKRTFGELKYNQKISADKAEITKNFLETIGL